MIPPLLQPTNPISWAIIQIDVTRYNSSSMMLGFLGFADSSA